MPTSALQSAAAPSRVPPDVKAVMVQHAVEAHRNARQRNRSSVWALDDELELDIARRYVAGEPVAAIYASIADECAEHGIAPRNLARWLRQVQTRYVQIHDEHVRRLSLAGLYAGPHDLPALASGGIIAHVAQLSEELAGKTITDMTVEEREITLKAIETSIAAWDVASKAESRRVQAELRGAQTEAIRASLARAAAAVEQAAAKPGAGGAKRTVPAAQVASLMHALMRGDDAAAERIEREIGEGGE